MSFECFFCLNLRGIEKRLTCLLCCSKFLENLSPKQLKKCIVHACTVYAWVDHKHKCKAPAWDGFKKNLLVYFCGMFVFKRLSFGRNSMFRYFFTMGFIKVLRRKTILLLFTSRQMCWGLVVSYKNNFNVLLAGG